MLVQFFIPHRSFIFAYENVLDWMQIIYVFTLLVGVANYIKINSKKVSTKIKGWGYNLVALSGLLVMVILGFAQGTGEDTPFLWMFNHIQE